MSGTWRRRAGLDSAVMVGFLLTLAGASTAQAEPNARAAASDVETAQQAQAKAYYERALALYRAGNYAPALTELSQAAALDPNGKDLFFNLALIHEKLGHFEQAIAALERFVELEPDPVEREHAQAAIERLKGAGRASAQSVSVAAPAPCPKPAPEATMRHGLSPVVVGAGAIALSSLVLGAVFGAKALADDPEGQATGG